MFKREVFSIYTAGLLQGTAMVAFPAAATILTSAQGYGLSSTEYGFIFLPDIVVAILASVMGGKLAHHGSLKNILLCGLGANILSMAVLLLSAFVLPQQSLAFGLLFVATGLLGLGFGLTVPALNTLTALYFPKKVDSAILLLNALLGLGTVLAPLLIALFTGMGFWWGLPLVLVVAISCLIFYSVFLPFAVEDEVRDEADTAITVIPKLFWLFAAATFLYGILETMTGNWATVYLTKLMNADVTEASFALASFWGMATLGRVLFAVSGHYISEKMIYKILPFVIALAYVCVYLQDTPHPWSGVWLFGLAGFGCSALLPLSISFASNALPSIRKSVAGGLVATYLAGYGVSAFGVGPMENVLNYNLQVVFGLCAFVAIALGVIAYFITNQRKRA